MKATAKFETNIKPTVGGGAIAILPVGGYVFGTVGATDIIGFDHYYSAAGLRYPLVTLCKAFIGTNLIITNETEPDVDPEPATGQIYRLQKLQPDGTFDAGLYLQEVDDPT